MQNTNGVAMLKHNQAIVEIASFWYFKNKKTLEINSADSAIGPYIIAFNEQKLAEEVYNDVFAKEYEINRVDNIDMVQFYNRVSNESGVRQNFSGIVLNLPRNFIIGEGDIMFEGELPLHIFQSEELM